MKFYSLTTLAMGYDSGRLDRDENKLVINHAGNQVRLWDHKECIFEMTCADLLTGLLNELNIPWMLFETSPPDQLLDARPGQDANNG